MTQLEQIAFSPYLFFFFFYSPFKVLQRTKETKENRITAEKQRYCRETELLKGTRGTAGNQRY